jgi:hypothetical protein
MPKRSHKEALHDEGFVKFLAQSNRSELVPLYMENPDSAVRRMRDVFLTPVWWSMQEYKNTEEHREQLKRDVQRAVDELDELKHKLAAAEARPVGKKIATVPSCAEGHPLAAFDGKGYEECNLCHEWTYSGIELIKQCKPCRKYVCRSCMQNEDIGLHLFMSRNCFEYTRYRFNILRQKAGYDMKEPEENLREINRLREEFYNTEQHRVDLREQIKLAEDRVRDAETALADAERRAVAAV